MKKLLIFILAAALILAGCSSVKSEDTAASPTPVPTPTVEPTPEPTPEWTGAKVRIGNIGAIYTYFDRGEMLNIIDEDGDWYIADLGDVSVFVDKSLVRTEWEEFPEERILYGAKEGFAYSNPYGEGEPVMEIEVNKELNVIDEFGDLMLVEADGVKGYLKSELTRETKVSYGYSGGWDGGGGGGGGGGGADGGDIQLSYSSQGYTLQLLTEVTYSFPYNGMVLADEAEGYLTIYKGGESVMVTNRGDEVSTVYDGVNFASVPAWLLIFDLDEPYETWTGYAKSGTLAYNDYRMYDLNRKLDSNTEVEVIYAIGDNLIIEKDDEILFTEKTNISEERISYGYSGGWDGGGGGGGGGGDWTPPAL